MNVKRVDNENDATLEKAFVSESISTQKKDTVAKTEMASDDSILVKCSSRKDEDSTFKDFQSEENGSETKNQTKVEKSAVIICILKEGKNSVATCSSKEDNVARRHELKHRCTQCDFQTSFRGKLSTHLIRQHPGVRKEKEKTICVG